MRKFRQVNIKLKRKKMSRNLLWRLQAHYFPILFTSLTHLRAPKSSYSDIKTSSHFITLSLLLITVTMQPAAIRRAIRVQASDSR